MRGRLNAFQRTMLRWRELHPYSAAHVVAVEAPLAMARLSTAIDDELARRGISHIALDAAHRRFSYAAGGAHASVRELPAGGDVAARIAEQIEAELNAPFPSAESETPMRFFALPAGAGFHLGLVYDHFIAGGDAIVGLLADIVARYKGAPTASSPPPLYPATYRRLFLRRPGAALLSLATIPALARSSRRALRPRYKPETDHYNAFFALAVGPASVARLVERAKAWGVTRNDLLIALLMLALAPGKDARPGARRNEVAVASIVNVRRDFGPVDGAAFGQFLASFRVSHAVAPDTAVEALARDVHAQTAAIKRGKLHLRTIYAIAFAGALWPHLDAGQRNRLFAKYHPVWGAITMLDVNPLWAADAAGAPPDYVRGVSTGPLSPLVLAVTPIGNRMNLGFSFRTACYSREHAARIAADLIERLDSL